jgi:hypothetical protein
VSKTTKTYVQSRHWGPDDDYAVVEVQVWEDKMPIGSVVWVTVETEAEYQERTGGK